jgi:hypothetical protein
MNANARKARATTRQMAHDTRAVRRAQRAVATGVASAKSHLVAAGLDVDTAARFAGAFSRGMTAQGKRAVSLKLRGRRAKRVEVKLYDLATFAARLATYRPKDKEAAARFDAVAA